MKKHLLILNLLFALPVLITAQIINPSFENWTTGNPDGWTTGNAGPYTFVLESNDAHDGSLAVLDRVVSFVGTNFASPLCYGPICMGAQTSTAPQAIHGWYKMTSVGSDFVDATAALFDNSGIGTGAGLTTFSGSDVYKEFVINLYYTSGVPNGDSLLIDFILINDTAGKVHNGSSFTLDDLSFGALSAISSVPSQSSTAMEMISPNPSAQDAEITYHIETEGITQLNIYDISGHLVKKVINEQQGPGRYKATADVSDLPQGIYFCKLVSGSSSDFLKLEIQR